MAVAMAAANKITRPTEWLKSKDTQSFVYSKPRIEKCYEIIR